MSGHIVSKGLYCPVMRRALIYTRVSSDNTGHGRSVAEQEAECRSTCEHNGWEVAHVFTDNDRGASRWSRVERPEYRRLASTLQPGDVLVTWEASRAQRDLAAYVELRDLCAKLGVLWCYSGRVYDLSKGDDRFSTGLDALLSEKEAEQTRERVMRGVRAAVAEGKPHGKLPYGYRIRRDPDTGKPIDRVPHEEQAAIIREMVRRSIAGEAMYSIVKDLNDRGIPAPRPKFDGTVNTWEPSGAIRMIKSPTYIAKRTHRGQIVGDATWEPLISMEDHEALMRVFSNPARKFSTGHEPRWLLSGLALCGVCGGKTRVAHPRGYASYICKVGFHTSRSAKGMDDLVTDAVVARLASPDLLEELMGSQNTGEDVMAEARALRDRLDAFVDAAASGELTPAALARIEAKLLPQITAAERQARASAMSPLLAQYAGLDPELSFVDADIKSKRAVIALLMKIEMMPASPSRFFHPNTVRITYI